MSSINNTPDHTSTRPQGEHGTMASYVIGFLLSLIFTLIPYYLVVEHIVSGNVLVATILAFAIAQMIIQIVFFLHLGREPKPHWNLGFFIATVGIILVVVGGSLLIMHNLHYNMSPVTPVEASKKLVDDEGIYQIGGEKTGACQGVHANHKVIIKGGQVSPAQTTAQKCDTLTFINEDESGAGRNISFGTYVHHQAYAGQAGVMIRKGRAKTITLSEPGTYQFYDHAYQQTRGSFTVTPQQ